MESVSCLDCRKPVDTGQPARPVHYTVKVRRRFRRAHGFVHGGCQRRGRQIQSDNGYASVWAPIGDGEDLPPAPCEACGRLVILSNDPRRRRTVCSPRCAVAVTPSHQKAERQPACSMCGGTLEGRTDTEYCSPRCRQKAYRARKREST